MSRSEHFAQGSMEHVDPTTLHPNMNDYRAEVGRGEGSESSVGYVPTHILASMHGNETGREGIDRHKRRLLSGEGFEDPVMVEFDPKRKVATLGEGNHRVEAARELGISHVPARVVRSRIDADGSHAKHSGGVTQPIDATSPWKGGMGEEYWPPQIHPRHIFGEDVR